MFGRHTQTPKDKKPLEPRPTRTTSIEEVLIPIPELGTQNPYNHSYFCWINPENTVTLEDIATLYQYQYGKEFPYHIPAEITNSIWYTPYPEPDILSSQCFEIPAVWGGNKR